MKLGQKSFVHHEKGDGFFKVFLMKRYKSKFFSSLYLYQSFYFGKLLNYNNYSCRPDRETSWCLVKMGKGFSCRNCQVGHVISDQGMYCVSLQNPENEEFEKKWKLVCHFSFFSPKAKVIHRMSPSGGLHWRQPKSSFLLCLWRRSARTKGGSLQQLVSFQLFWYITFLIFLPHACN